jgi:Rieske Fe-S protein
MNFKKIALVVAIASSFGAHAADLSLATDTTILTTVGAVVAAQPMVVSMLPSTATLADGNTAYVIQEGVADGGSVAYVSQQGGGPNYAAVLQQGMGALAFVDQNGANASRAVLISIDATGTTPRAVGLAAMYGDAAATAAETVSELAEKEIAAVGLSADGNVQLVRQLSDNAENTAFIYTKGTNNFAAIDQSVVANVAVISQIGDGNRAFILQK